MHVHWGGPLFRGKKRVGSALGGHTTADGSLSFLGGLLPFPLRRMCPGPSGSRGFDLGALRLERGSLLVGASWSDGGSVTRKRVQEGEWIEGSLVRQVRKGMSGTGTTSLVLFPPFPSLSFCTSFVRVRCIDEGVLPSGRRSQNETR